jgi:ABC-2 type transport system permease protein
MVKKIKTNTRKGVIIKKMIIGFAGIILLNILADTFYKRIDLTKEGRFTLSSSTEKLIDKIEDDLYITVFLDGDIPLDYKRLKSATRDMLNEYRLTSSGKISFDFEDVLEDKELKDKEKILGEIYSKGLRIERSETAPDEVYHSRRNSFL